MLLKLRKRKREREMERKMIFDVMIESEKEMKRRKTDKTRGL